VLYANGFGAASATVRSAGLVAPGQYQFNVVVPPGTPDGDQPIAAAYNGQSTQAGTLLTVQHQDRLASPWPEQHLSLVVSRQGDPPVNTEFTPP
jgi:hypothetical protein